MINHPASGKTQFIHRKLVCVVSHEISRWLVKSVFHLYNICILLTAFQLALHSSRERQSPTPTIHRDLTLGKLAHLSVPPDHHTSNKDLQYSSQELWELKEEYMKALNGVWKSSSYSRFFTLVLVIWFQCKSPHKLKKRQKYIW